MSFGMARGLDFEAFCKAVKTMKLVVISGSDRWEAEMPLEMYNVSISKINVQIPEKEQRR